MKNFRWYVVILCFFAIIINYLDRSAISYAISDLKITFNLSNSTFGMIASIFGFGYLIMTFIGGIWVDRYGARKVWSIACLLWSFACIMIGLATGFWFLIIMRLLLGMAEGPGFPAMARTTADWLPLSERATAISIGLAAVPFSAVIGAPLITFLIMNTGWRMMFVILGCLGIIWGVCWFLFFRDAPHQSRYVKPEELRHITSELVHNLPQKAPNSVKDILLNPYLFINNFAFFCFGYVLFFSINWLPGYLEQSYQLKLGQVGLYLTFPWLAATGAMILGGIISDKIWVKTKNIRLARAYPIWISQLLGALCFTPLIWHPTFDIMMICLTLGLSFVMMANAAYYQINADIAHEKVATSLGIMTSISAISAILAPLLTGYLTNYFGNFNTAFSLLIVLLVLSGITVLFFQYPDVKRMRTQPATG